MKPWIILWSAMLVVVLAVQFQLGAYHCDLGGDPDEAAHAVTALMVRDYVTQAPGQHPLHFAQAYYERLPKVALGHYPPVYYVVAGAWLLPWVNIKSLLVLQAVLIALLGTITAYAGSKFLPRSLAIGAGVMLCLCSPFLKIGVLVMSDVLLGIACFVAVLSFIRFMQRPGVWPALGFGFAASAAILTKGSGWMLAVLPPIAIALTGQWRLLLRPALWIAPVPVAVFALPWQVFSLKFTEEGMSGLTPAQHCMMAIPFYAEAAWANAGPVVLALLVLSLATVLVQRFKGTVPGAEVACLVAYLAGGLLLMLSVPAGVSSRYFIPLVGPVLLLVLSTFPRKPAVLLACVGASLLWAMHDKTYVKDAEGFGSVINHLAASAGDAPWLLCADSRGEGALVAAAAYHPLLRKHTNLQLLRATKELADTDWVSAGYKLRFADDAALLADLKSKKVAAVVLDDSVTGIYRQAHFDQLKHALAQPQSGWKLEQTFNVSHDGVQNRSMLVFVPADKA